MSRFDNFSSGLKIDLTQKTKNLNERESAKAKIKENLNINSNSSKHDRDPLKEGSTSTLEIISP